MKQLLLCFALISSGMLLAAKKAVVTQLSEANHHLAEVETNAESKISSIGFSLFIL